MRLEGSYRLDAEQSVAYSALNDPAVIAQSIPGCERLIPKGNDTYEAVLRAGAGGPSVSYSGAVAVRDQDPPRTYRLLVEGKGPGAFVSGDSLFTLRAVGEDATEVRVRSEIAVDGVAALIGERFLLATARTLMSQFFRRVNAHLKTIA